MNKIKYAFIVASLLAGVMSAPVFATEATGSTTTAAQLQQLIQSLQQQIANLQAQIKALNEARSQVQEAAKDVSSTFKLISQLRYGMTGDDVKLLQQILATDPDIYPEGLITGKFGKLTENAVKRFQKKACISQVGNVGPQTMRRINELLQEGAGNSGHVPPGLLRAPGIQKKLCSTSTSTTTLDTVPPVMTSIVAAGASTSATITWTTNENANSKVYYGTVSPLVVSTTTLYVSDAAYVSSHSLTITGLNSNTVYYYIVSSVDQAGNKALDTEKSFTTSDIIAPVLSSVTVGSLASTSATITWTTNENANSKVYYGTATPLAISTSTANVVNAAYVSSHSLNLTGLTAGTTYYYVVNSIDQSGNSALGTEKSFTTPTL